MFLLLSGTNIRKVLVLCGGQATHLNPSVWSQVFDLPLDVQASFARRVYNDVTGKGYLVDCSAKSVNSGQSLLQLRERHGVDFKAVMRWQTVGDGVAQKDKQRGQKHLQCSQSPRCLHVPQLGSNGFCLKSRLRIGISLATT